jgi:dGTPase
MTEPPAFHPAPPPAAPCRWLDWESLLGPSAARASRSRGRRVFEPHHPERSPFMRDRDRIVHAQAFRRLMHKTQVYVGPKIDHLRTRLTHTLEVAQIARTAARAVGLNEDLTEAVALVHDLGHPPFGHAGERALDRLLAAHGGFEHNRHTLERVESLESRTPKYPGLNLSYEVLAAVAHRCKRPDHPAIRPFLDEPPPPAEGRLVDLCDSIAYDAHDLDDAIRAGLVQRAEAAELAVWKLTARDLAGVDAGHPLFPRMVVGRIVDLFATDLIARLRAAATFDGLAESPYAREKRELEAFLLERVYRHPEVAASTAAGERDIERLFAAYTRDPGKLPESSKRRLEMEPVEIVVGHHLAGMTDRYAKECCETLGA